MYKRKDPEKETIPNHSSCVGYDIGVNSYVQSFRFVATNFEILLYLSLYSVFTVFNGDDSYQMLAINLIQQYKYQFSRFLSFLFKKCKCQWSIAYSLTCFHPTIETYIYFRMFRSRLIRLS